jgi:DNA-binding response OmpR family regulator
VEDSRTQALKFQYTLKKHGYHVIHVQNGLEAMTAMLNNDISIVITDWIMPEMDGSELCRAIRKHDFGKYVYIFLLTARDSKNDIVEGLESGADDYLTKPVDDNELIARLSSAERIVRLESSLKKRNHEIAMLSITDPLTQVYNRLYLNESSSRSHQAGRPLSAFPVHYHDRHRSFQNRQRSIRTSSRRHGVKGICRTDQPVSPDGSGLGGAIRRRRIHHCAAGNRLKRRHHRCRAASPDDRRHDGSHGIGNGKNYRQFRGCGMAAGITG